MGFAGLVDQESFSDYRQVWLIDRLTCYLIVSMHICYIGLVNTSACLFHGVNTCVHQRGVEDCVHDHKGDHSGSHEAHYS